jgi:hypothetical protein
MRLSEVDQGQQSWAAFLNGPIQEAYRDLLNSEIARVEYDAKAKGKGKGKGKKKNKPPTTACGSGCSGAGSPKKEHPTTACGSGCSGAGSPKKKGEEPCSPDKPKPGTYKKKAQSWFTKPV